MIEADTPSTETDVTESSFADEMEIGLLRRGDGKLSIVGLGGSAGSILALQEFLTAMPVDTGLAFVIILHLSPDHESTLAEMFQRSTAMPVMAATDGITVGPNCVYVIPPGKFLASVDGYLRLTDAREPRGKRVAVDYFFRTLAETHGAHALAVVLSGMGGDGALGLKRIKELGGLTIAQDPDEAEHPDMPRSAIAAGVVDWVLGVKEMPAKLLAYVKQRAELTLPGEEGPHPAEKAEPTPDDHEAALRDVLAFLNTRTGRDFSYYKRATILRRIARRMQVNGLSDLPSYLVYMRTHAGEPGALLQDLLISVTNFFRGPASFAALERTIPEMFKGKGPGDTVRVWVAGCATGEEAYSIAILLSEHAATLVGPPQLQVFATDLDEEVIREARAGLYPETISADVSEERLRHFFIHEPGGFRVRRAVRELVLFAPHDLLKDSPFSRLDLVSCRNLLIYLKREAQSRAFDIFHFALRPGGRLFLGTSEAVDDASPLFAVLDKNQRLYTHRPAPQRLIAVPTGPGTLARSLALQERARERPTVPGSVTVANVQGGLGQLVPLDSGLPPGELHYRLIERFSPPSIVVNSMHEIVHLSESAGRFLQFTGGEPTRNLLRTVHPMLRVELRAALYAAAQTHVVVAVADVPVEMGDARSLVDIRVTPAGELAPDFLLVVFEQHPADGAAAVAAPESGDADQAVLLLERELVATKSHLRDTIEQSEASTEELKASNEELQAINEELRSATEELETSREELQSINEELRTVNDELKSNVDQLAQSNNDLQNLMAATDIATVFLDRELCVQRFTPSARTLFNFISSDLGRPLSDLSRQLEYPELVDDAERSLAHLKPTQREVSAGELRFLARALPYRTADDHIAGVVLTFTDITTIKQGEDATARLAAIVESSSDAIIGKDLRGIVTSWNVGAKKVFGYDASEMIGQPIVRLIPADRRDEEVEILRRVGDGETINSFETVRVRNDGTEIPIAATISPIKDAAGRTIGVSKIARDITSWRKAEQSERAGRERLRMALHAARMVAWEYDPATGAVVTSENASDVYGFPPGEGTGNIDRWLNILHPDDLERHRARLAKAVVAGEEFTSLFRIVRPDTDAVQWIEQRGHIVLERAGAAVRLFGVDMDITARMEAEAALHQSEERFAFVRRSSGVGFWYCDLPFDVLEWDDLVKDHFHLPPDAIVTIQTFYERMHPDDREPTRQAIERSIAGRTHYTVEYRTLHPDTGAVKWVRAIGRTGYAPDGSPIQFDGVTLDVSDYKNAEAALREADRRKDEFLAILAHELRNPLAPISSGLKVIQLAGSDGTIEQARAMMERQLVQMTRLVDDLLDVSRLTTGKLELRMERLELREVIDAALETSRPVIDQQDHELSVEMPRKAMYVDGDPIRLAQVVSNLLTNAAKYTHRGGHLRLTVGCDDEAATIAVADDGIGIPTDMLATVFGMFTQVDRTLEKTTGGLGIGLSLVKGLVEMHGGTIEARSEGQGKGSEFKVRLPSAKSAVSESKSGDAEANPVGLAASMRILVVDDNVDAADSLGQLLEIMGNEVLTAYDGESGIKAAREFQPSVVLCDIGMPKMNGYDTARNIRAEDWGRTTVLVALTGWGQEDNKRSSAEAGFDHHLVKPIEVDALMTLLASVVPAVS